MGLRTYGRAAVFHGQACPAHVEGGYSLLKRTLEGLVLESGSPETLAASYLRNLVTAASRLEGLTKAYGAP